VIKVLISGATGFVGKSLIQRIATDSPYVPIAAVRRTSANLQLGIDSVTVDNLSSETNWRMALSGVKVVIHAAARTHILNETSSDPLAEFRKINADGTLNLARQAAEAEVRRLVFISSIGVNGNKNSRPFTENDSPHPVEPYAVSKLEAEVGLRQLAEETGMEMVIIRPPLVYGPNAPGNFGRLIRAVDKGFYLPLGAIHNKRSFVALDNLVDLIVTCVDHPGAGNQTFLVSDGEDLSTTELLQRLAISLDKPVRLIPVPANLLVLGATLLGKRDLLQKLCVSLQVDISKARKLLGWEPPVSVDEALLTTAKKFLENAT